MSDAVKPRIKDTYVADALVHLRSQDSVASVDELPKNAFDAISSDQDVIDAFRALSECISDTGLEPNLYDPICVLCNCIMAAVARHAPLTTDDILIFRHPSSEMMKGDSLHERFKPDIVGIVSCQEDLFKVVDMSKQERDAYSKTSTHLQLVICGAEIKTARKPKGQIFNYLVNMKLHRPDIPTMHGFQFEKNHFTLYSLNAGGMVSSKELDAGNLENWIAYVALAYQALQDHDTDLRGVPQEAFVRWDLTLDGTTIPLAPFQVGTVPGRGTWVALQVDAEAGPEYSRDVTEAYHTKAPVGFVKVSWQDVKGNFEEGKLLDMAHGFCKWYPSDAEPENARIEPENASIEPDDASIEPEDASIEPEDAKTEPEDASWIPGLVRHLHYRRYDGKNDPTVGLPGGVQRQKEVLLLGSVGQPLSQCESLHHLLCVMFDALGVSLQLAERGIIHRDMSWFNILCKPKHDPKTLAKCPTIDHRPCIDYILSEKDLQDCEPCALITDLDHSAVIEMMEGARYTPRDERTGTPMFIALELSDPEPSSLVPRHYDLKSLVKRFKRLESAYPTAFSRAFPEGNKEFLKCFRKVIREEKKASDSGTRRFTDPTEPNRLHHDAESIWWAMMWALLRAAPMNEDGEYIKMDGFNSRALHNYSERCNQLLNHRPGGEEGRAPCIKDPLDFVLRHLHTLLKTPAKVLIEIATYFTVPWHRYVDSGDKTGTVRRDHAHQAMRRLLLLAILEQQGDPILFSTDAPRTLTPVSGQDRVASATLSGHKGSGMAQEVVQIALAPSAANTRTSVKRSHADADASNDGDVHEYSKDEESSGDGGDDPKDGDYVDESKNKARKSKKAKTTVTKDTYEVPGDPIPDSVFDWINKFYIDTVKWFGTGR